MQKNKVALEKVTKIIKQENMQNTEVCRLSVMKTWSLTKLLLYSELFTKLMI